MPDIFTITFNPAVDISTSVDRVQPVRKLRCRAETRFAGGGGINVARVINRLGGDVEAFFLAGGVVGEQLKQLVANEHVPSVVLTIDEQTRESFTVVDETTKDEFRFVMPGPHLSVAEYQAAIDRIDAIASASKYIVASGSLPHGVPDHVYGYLAGIARKTGALLVIDAAGVHLQAALAEGVHLVKPNLGELQGVVAEPLSERSAQVRACRRLIEAGRSKMVALTMGSEGALLVTEEGAWFADPLPVDVVGTVGAGDSFLGCMVWALSTGQGPEQALKFAVAGGSAALLVSGTQLCQPEDVRRLAPLVRLQRL